MTAPTLSHPARRLRPVPSHPVAASRPGTVDDPAHVGPLANPATPPLSAPGAGIPAVPHGFVLVVDLDPEAYAAMPAEVLQAAETLRELAREWLPQARTRTLLSTESRIAPASVPSEPSFRARLAALPDVARVRIDIPGREVSVAGAEVRLTPTEFDLLAHLATASGRVVTRDELRRTVWRGREVSSDSRTVDVHVRRLRAVPELGRLIATVHGVGYRLQPRPHLEVVN